MREEEKKRLGEGAEALFSSEEVSEETVKGSVDSTVLRQAIEKMGKKPVTSVWSRPIKVMLFYLFLTVPGFRPSVEAEKMLKEGLKTKYPELWEKIEQALA